MVSSTYSAVNADDPYELLIQSIVSIEGQPKTALEEQKAGQQKYKKVLSDFDSTLSSLHKLLKTFTDRFSTPFDDRTAVLPEGASFGVSTTEKAPFGTHTLQVERLAATDTRLSQQYTQAGTALSGFVGQEQTFQIEVAEPTDADPNNRVFVPVTLTPSGTTDAEILQEVSTAINDAMGAAVQDGTISATARASASVVNETSDTARLSLRSGQTGYANRLAFQDSAGGLLAALQVDAAGVATGTGGGQVTAVGTSETDSMLNSKFQLDGLTLYRAGNTVSDALPGMTLTLRQTMDAPTDFSVEADDESIAKSIGDFIEQYNAALDFIQSKTNVDGDLEVRGALAGDSAVRSLRFSMRQDVVTQVTGLPPGAPSFITELGIAIGNDGTLSLDDEDQLIEAIESDPSAVQAFFGGDDGVATRLFARVDAMLGPSGVLDGRIDSVDEGIRRLDDRIQDWDERLSLRENTLRQQYAKLQETIVLLQGQQSSLSGFLYGAY